MAISVLLAEDHTLVRSGVRALLEGAGMTILGEAGDGLEAVKMTARLRPDVAVLDVAMPKLNGIEAARRIRTEHPDTRVVMLSMHQDRRYIFEALKAGAGGYLLKGSPVDELIAAVRAVAAGGTFLSRDVAGVALDDYVRRAQNGPASDRLDALSAREREVLQLIAEGKSSPEIARVLHISSHTVDTHRRNIMEKLDTHNLAGLIKFAIRHGLAGLD